MDTTPDTHDSLEPAFTIAELAEQLCVSTQALYDLRSKGRGPHGFRVGRHIRFRRSEVEAWLARLERQDHDRHDQDRHDQDRHDHHRDDPRGTR